MKNAPEILLSLLQKLAVAIIDSMERCREKRKNKEPEKYKKTSTLLNKAFMDYKNEKGQWKLIPPAFFYFFRQTNILKKSSRLFGAGDRA